jgi:acetolactate synthase-1/2/3 large subunit
MIGDGAFNYNPVPAGLGFAQEYGTPLLVIVFNNGGYQAMGMGHRFMYPEGAAVRRDDWYGVHINPAPDYARLAEAFGGYGEKLEDPAGIRAAVERCLAKVKSGRTALLDVVLGQHGSATPGAH